MVKYKAAGGGCQAEMLLETTSRPTNSGRRGVSAGTATEFVVQFAAETAMARGRLVGRVEHAVSGQAGHCHNLDELLACLERVLTALEPAQPIGRRPRRWGCLHACDQPGGCRFPCATSWALAG
jgi:hypothetical protein